MDWEGLKLLIWINLLFAGKVDKHYWETGLTENRSSSGLPKMFTAIQLYVRWFKKVCQDDNGSIHNILKAMTFHLFVGPPQWPYLQWIKNVLYMLKNFMTNICCIRTLLALLCTLSTFWNSVPPFCPVSVYACRWPFQDDVSKSENEGTQHQILYLKQLPVCLSIFLCLHDTMLL